MFGLLLLDCIQAVKIGGENVENGPKSLNLVHTFYTIYA
jgi:hypothetical protein